MKPDGIHSGDKRSQAKEDKVYQCKSDVADAKDRRVRRRTGACYICGDKRHYQPSYPLRRHRDSLFCDNCQRYGHVESGCRSKGLEQRETRSKRGAKDKQKSQVAAARMSNTSNSDSDSSSSNSICREICEVDEVCARGNNIGRCVS